MEELKELHDTYAFHSITFWDDTFTVNPDWINDFCKEYKKEGFAATIAANSRADIICDNEEMIEELANIGLDWLAIGFESGSQRILDFLDKGTTVEQNLEAARICRKYGIKIFATFMLGLPAETQKEQLQTVNMIRDIAPEHPSLFYFTPIPGTNIYQYCLDNDLILRDDPFDIDRTGNYKPKIKGIDYSYLDKLKTYV